MLARDFDAGTGGAPEVDRGAGGLIWRERQTRTLDMQVTPLFCHFLSGEQPAIDRQEVARDGIALVVAEENAIGT